MSSSLMTTFPLFYGSEWHCVELYLWHVILLIWWQCFPTVMNRQHPYTWQISRETFWLCSVLSFGFVVANGAAMAECDGSLTKHRLMIHHHWYLWFVSGIGNGIRQQLLHSSKECHIIQLGSPAHFILEQSNSWHQKMSSCIVGLLWFPVLCCHLWTF